MRTREQILHPGEIKAQELFHVEEAWNDESLDKMFKTEIENNVKGFIESLPFFFIATSDENGNCDCSYRGCEFYENGEIQPPLKVLAPRSLVFPDFTGNKLYNSFGNMLQNPHIGMLFIDFGSASRLRLNGQVQIFDDVSLYRDIWPGALRYVKVTVDQVFGNCRKRIPKLGPV